VVTPSPRRIAVSLWALAVGFALASAAGCVYPKPSGTGVADLGGAPDAGLSANTLGPSDLVEVRVFGEPDLTGVYWVAPEGFVDFPLCGRVAVVGLSPSGAADALTACLKKGFLRRPQVTVLIKEFNSKKVFVFGEVTKPGALAYEEGMTIVHALSEAGGFTRTASKNAVNITRIVDGREKRLAVKVEDIFIGREKNVPVLPGDIIFVPESIL